MPQTDSGPIDLLIVGAGMYVCGKGTQGLGTILPAAFEAVRKGRVRTIHLAAATQKSAGLAKKKSDELQGLTKVTPDIRFYPQTRDDPKSYLEAADRIKGPCAAIVCVPDALHFEVTSELIQRGIHVQVVKPLVPTVKENQALIDLKNKHQVYGCVEYHKRFDHANLKLFDLIRKGELGDLLHFCIKYSQRKIIPTTLFRGWVETTNIFQYLGVHYVDLIHFLTQARPMRLMSLGTKKYLTGQGIDTYDTIQTLIQWKQENSENTFLSSHLTGWIDPDISTAMSDQRMEVIGTQGRYRSDQKNRGVTFVADQHGYEEINPYFCQFYQDEDNDAMRIQGYGAKSILQFIKDASDIIYKKKNPRDLKGARATFESSLVIAKVLEASQKSLGQDNNWIEI